jgi:hypothetical protein
LDRSDANGGNGQNLAQHDYFGADSFKVASVGSVTQRYTKAIMNDWKRKRTT